MTVEISVEADGWSAMPGLEALVQQATAAALRGRDVGDVCILFSDNAEVQALNAQWRGKNKPTNVLSFPATAITGLPEGEDQPLGDIVLAVETVLAEAQAQGKTPAAHTTHLVVHGILHLLGYDHENDDDATLMEQTEREILAGLGIADPYQT
jgi:probable rRNA maturation factor